MLLNPPLRQAAKRYKQSKNNCVKTFEKINEKIEGIGKYSFIMIRELKSDYEFSNLSDYEIINNVISSEFHLWLGENRTEIDNLPNSYGYHDNNELEAIDYKLISFENFKVKLITIIQNWHVNEPELIGKAETLINSNMSSKSIYYFLDLNENEKKAEWSVYSVFAGFISINKLDGIVSLIEFGED